MKQLEALFAQYASMFTEQPGKTNGLKHCVETGDAIPWRCNPRPLSNPKRAGVDKALDEMLDTGAIGPPKSPWTFPIVPVEKKDGSMSICVDYRKLNALTVRDAYPFPSIQEITMQWQE